MNKTVNINLGGLLFHIDEDAFIELRKYLDRLNKSFENEEGAEEIITDIEARIAEIFNDAKENELQVINLKNVEDTIAIMGTPEELNEEEEEKPKTEAKNETFEQPKPRKQLYRDASEAYVSGVSAGVSHYLGLDVFWVRLALVLSAVFTGGSVLLVYLIFWIFVPEAKTTAEKLEMKGKSVNVNNIEQKIKEGFDNVSDNVKTAYNNVNTDEFKNKSAEVFNRLGKILGRIFSAIGIFIGILLMFASGTGIIAIFTGFIGKNLGFLGDEWFQIDALGLFGIQPWLTSFLVFLIASIPLAFIFLLGFRITFRKSKKVSKTLKLSLLGIWILAIVGIIVSDIIEDNRLAVSATSSITETLPYTAQDTLFLKMHKDERFVYGYDFDRDFKIRETATGEKVLVSQNLKIYIETTKTGEPYIEIEKIAKGPNYNIASEKAEKVKYDFEISEKELILNAFALSNYDEGYANQKVKVKLVLPESITVYADRSTKSYNNRKKSDEYVTIKNKEHHYLKLQNGKAVCSDCYEDEWNEDTDINIDLDLDFDDENFENELEEKIENFIESRIEIDEDNDQIDFNGKNIDIKINEDGIQIKTEKE